MRSLTDRQRKAMFAKRGASRRGPSLVRGKAGEALILKHKGLVRRVAQQFRRRFPGAQLEDLVQEGNLGLLRAGKLYRKRPGAKFSTYAHHHIAKRIREAAQGSHTVHVPEKQLRKGVHTLRSSLTSTRARKYFATTGDDGGIGRAHAKATLSRLFRKLPELERHVMRLRHLNGQLTHREAAKKLKKSVSTVHALEKRAWARLKRARGGR